MLRDSEMLVAAAQKLKDYEIKSTPQRQVILAYLMKSKVHPRLKRFISISRRTILTSVWQPFTILCNYLSKRNL